MIEFNTPDKEIMIELEQGEHQGRKWWGKFEICENPVCHCDDLFLIIAGDPPVEQDNAPPFYSFGIDVDKKKAIPYRTGEEDPHYDAHFAKTFVNDLTDENWSELLEYYYNYKKRITKKTPLDKIELEFPWKEIEEGAMIGYHETFPWAESIYMEVDKRRYMLDDQYCLASNCKCKEAVLVFLPESAGKKIKPTDLPYIRFDYRTKTWEIENPGSDFFPGPKEFVNEVVKERLPKVFKKRHKTLRRLYSAYLLRLSAAELAKRKEVKKAKKAMKAKKKALDASPDRKIGRNEPCPCGSGKKYKKCCM